MTLDIDLVVLELKLHAFIAMLERRYNPDQPRVPAGNSSGGQWSGVGGTSGPSSGRAGNGSTQVAYAGRLDKAQLMHMERTYFWLCNYSDMFGRRWGFSLKLELLCPETWPAPPLNGR